MTDRIVIRRSLALLALVAALVFWGGCATGGTRRDDPGHGGRGGSGSIQWLRYSEAAKLKEEAGDRPLMIYFTADPCDPCETMNRWTFADKKVGRAAKGFAPVRIRGDIEINAARRFGIRTYPTIVFFSLTDGEIDRKAGFKDPAAMLLWLEEVRENKTTISALMKTLESEPENVEALLKQARNYLDADRVDEALVLAQRAGDAVPEDARVDALIGLCHIRAGRPAEAEAAIDAALARDGDNEEARSLKIMILLDKAGDTLVRGEAAEAMELLSAALEIDAENFEAHIWTGRALIKLDRGQDAQASFRRAGELHPDSPIPPEALGNYYQEVGDEEAAEKEFLRAIEIDPQYESPHFRLIELYEKQGRQADMMGMYEKVLPLSPAGAHNEIAWLMATSEHEDIRDPGAAIKHATLAVEMEPSPWYIDTLAEAYYAAGKYAIAVAVIKEAIAKDPGDMEYYEGQLKKFQDAKKAAFREKE